MKCKICKVELKPHYYQEPFTSTTPIGLCWDDDTPKRKAPIDYLSCPECGLMYQMIGE